MNQSQRKQAITAMASVLISDPEFLTDNVENPLMFIDENYDCAMKPTGHVKFPALDLTKLGAALERTQDAYWSDDVKTELADVRIIAAARCQVRRWLDSRLIPVRDAYLQSNR